jgi:hypothetical protein
MAFIYERDDAHKLIKVTFRGPYRANDGVEILERQRVEDVGTYRILYDLRDMTGQPSLDDLRMFMSLEPTCPDGRPRGPVAIIVIDPTLYNMSCIYAAMGKPKFTMNVFRDPTEAEQWLKGGEPNGSRNH